MTLSKSIHHLLFASSWLAISSMPVLANTTDKMEIIH
ncbi:Uncharacterised protein [Shewanella putrefaciens]|nr:Uncharacterised protein [Shewanella putrefaciens]